VAGYTGSSDFPTANPYQGTLNGTGDAFVTKLSATGSSLIYSTYLGGSNSESGYSIKVDPSGSAYVAGYTGSSDFPTANPYQGTLNGTGDAFVTKLSPAGNSLIYSTYLGGSADDRGIGIAVDASGSAYLTGHTGSSDFPTANPYQGTFSGKDDAFVTKLSVTGASLIYSTYLGGSEVDFGFGIAVDASGSAYVIGYTISSDFPTANPFQGTYNGGADVFVTKFSFEDAACCDLAGDADNGGTITLGDVTYLIAYIFTSGPAPACCAEGDADGGGAITIGDVTYLIAHIYISGPAPICGPAGMSCSSQ